MMFYDCVPGSSGANHPSCHCIHTTTTWSRELIEFEVPYTFETAWLLWSFVCQELRLHMMQLQTQTCKDGAGVACNPPKLT